MAMVCNRHIPTLRNDLLDTTLSAVREERQRDPATSSLAAHYEYDPYGNLVYSLSTGNGNANPFRFSTKWFDAETHLGYWGYRYYSPRLGRWISRDPIGERGGLHLYGFVANHPTDSVDAWGLWITHYDDCNPTQRTAILAAHNAVLAVLPSAKADIDRFDTAFVLADYVIPNGRNSSPRQEAVYTNYRRKTQVVFQKMIDELRNGVGAECECTCADIYAYVWAPFGVSVGDIHFCPSFFNDLTPAEQAETFLHELSHLAANTDDLVFSWFPAEPGRAPDDAYYIMLFANQSVRDVTEPRIWRPIWP